MQALIRYFVLVQDPVAGERGLPSLYAGRVLGKSRGGLDWMPAAVSWRLQTDVQDAASGYGGSIQGLSMGSGRGESLGSSNHIAHFRSAAGVKNNGAIVEWRAARGAKGAFRCWLY